MRRSGIVGLGLLFLVWSSVLGRVNMSTFLERPALMIVFGSGMALGMMSFGIVDFWRAVWSARALVVNVPADRLSRRDSAVLRGITGHLYACGGIALIVGAVMVLSQLADLSKIGEGLAIVLLAPLYAVVTSELIVRPAARFIDETLSAGIERVEENPVVPAEAVSQDIFA